ncbi:MAG: hypothetical protein QM690_18730 [Sphingobium sp.]
MEISIGAYDKDSRTVPVTFTHGGVTHARSVNAVLKENGNYDRAATKDRVDKVALGVEVKIAAGVITNAPDPVVAAPAE